MESGCKNRMIITLVVEDGVLVETFFNGAPPPPLDDETRACIHHENSETKHVTSVFFATAPHATTQLCCGMVLQAGRWVYKCVPC